MSSFVVQIQNYQIIEKAILEFQDGLTIIIGPSNNGKSAIIRAIEAAIYNKAGNSFIRQGSEKTAVGIKYNDHTVVWSKSLDGGLYKVDGQIFSKIGRGQMDAVAKALNITELEVVDSKLRINFLKQMEYPFLLDKNGSQLFEFLAMSNDNDKLSDVFSTMRSDLKRLNGEIDKTTGSIDAMSNTLRDSRVAVEAYANIEALSENVLALDGEVLRTTKLRAIIDGIKAKKQSLIQQKPRILELRKGCAELDSRCSEIEKLVPYLSDLGKRVSALKNDLSTLKFNRDEILEFRALVTKYDGVLKNISIEDISNEQAKLNVLRSSIESIKSRANVLNNLNTNISSLNISVAKVHEEMSSFKVCPLCGKPLEEESHGCN